MTETKMYAVSIFWENDSDELVEMMDFLGDPGETVGQDGCQIVVTEQEMEDIREYAAEHHTEISIEESGEIAPSLALRLAQEWRVESGLTTELDIQENESIKNEEV